MKEGAALAAEVDDEVLAPLLGYMCTVRSLADAEQHLRRGERDCARRGAHLVEAYVRTYQTDLRTAMLALFHAKCVGAHTSAGGSGCQMDKTIEKDVIKRWYILRRQMLFEDGLLHMDHEAAMALMNVSMMEIRRLTERVDYYVHKRNDLAYTIMRRSFASCLIKCLEMGKAALGPGERLLCDYESVCQLGLCKDPYAVFELAANWMYHVEQPHHKKPAICYKCHKKRPVRGAQKARHGGGGGGGLECPHCGRAWFCSVECQLSDESQNLFAHQYECAYQQRRRRKEK